VTCQERRDLILLYAADVEALEPAERDELRAHLAGGCPSCAGALAEAEATMAQLPQALDPVTPSSHARDRLMQRVLATPKRRNGSLKLAPTVTTNPWWRYAAAALILIIAGLAALLAVEKARWDTSEKQLVAALGEKNVQIADLQSMLGSAQLKLMGLQAQPAQGERAGGRVLWDADRNEWHVYVFDLKAPPPGKEYELWFFPEGKPPMPGPTFMPDEKGNAYFRVSVPKGVAITGAGVTDEPTGGMPAPTGKLQLKSI
jgi:anti-sigma-K factor RskA